MQVRIYRPAKNAMQSGRRKVQAWLLEPVLSTARIPEPVMGWTASGDTDNQVRMHFATLEEALIFAQKKGWEAVVLPDRPRSVKPRNYADKFRYTPPPAAPVPGKGPESADRSRSSTG